jgi:hypothetical protein
MIEWLKRRSLSTRLLVYAAAAILAFALAMGVGATTALIIIQGNLSLPAREKPGPGAAQDDTPRRRGADADQSQHQRAAAQQGEAVEQKNTPRPQQVSVHQEETASQQDEAKYVTKVGDIQADTVETVLDSHDRILRYDALTADDIEEMRANQATLQEIMGQVTNLDPPQKYREHYKLFSSAISELYEATRLAYDVAADPLSATQTEFNEYDRHLNDADARLQRSNEILSRDYETLQDAQQVSPS